MIYKIVKTETSYELRSWPWHPQGKLLGKGQLIIRYPSEEACRKYLRKQRISQDVEVIQ